jgi:class 3 adenylate cyclase
MIDPVDRVVRAVARRHSSALVWLQFGIAHLVLLGGVGLLSLYEQLSATQFWVLTAVSQGVVALLSDLWELAVPVLLRHGGHANKFIGDAVNTAARVERATRETGDQVLITEDTRRRLRTQGLELVERKAVELKGKQVHVQLWAPRAHPAVLSRHDRAGASVAD